MVTFDFAAWSFPGQGTYLLFGVMDRGCDGKSPPPAYNPSDPALALSVYVVTVAVPGAGATGTVGLIGIGRGGPRVEMHVNSDVPWMSKHNHDLYITVDGRPLEIGGRAELLPTSIELPGLLIYQEPSSMTVTFIWDAGGRVQVMYGEYYY